MADPIQAIAMPKWGLAMEEGMVVEWHVEEGAEVAAGDEIADIETTKITNVFESPVGGTLRRHVTAAGETVPVGAMIGVIANASVGDEQIDAFIEQFNAEFAVRAKEQAAEAPSPQKCEVAGRSINYLDLGEGDGEAIVLVHGFGGDLNNWMFNQPVLAEQARVIALDLPGHGASSKDVGAGDRETLVGVLAGFLDALGLDRVRLAGHSLGGELCLGLALVHPDRVSGLTLLAPAGLGAEINGGYIEGFVAAGRRKQMKAVLQDLFADPGLVSRDMIEELLRYKRLDGVGAALRTISGSFFDGDTQKSILRNRLGEVSAPVRIVWGAEDRIIPAAQAEGLADLAEATVLDGAGHMVHMEAASEVNRLLGQSLI